MKRRLVSAVLALCVLSICLLLSGCGAQSAFEVIDTAVKNSQALEAVSAQMKMEMNMAMDGMTLSIPVTAEIKAKDMKNDKPTVFSTISASMMGQTMEITTYQEGDWVYMVMEDEKYKMTLEDAGTEYDYSDDMTDMLQALPEDLLKDVELVKEEDGSVSVTVTLPEETFADIYDDFIDGINSDSGELVEDVSISDAVVKITVANGYVSVYDMEFKMEMTTQGIVSKTEVKATVTYRDPGKEVTITPPEGYQSFEELSYDFEG